MYAPWRLTSNATELDQPKIEVLRSSKHYTWEANNVTPYTV